MSDGSGVPGPAGGHRRPGEGKVNSLGGRAEPAFDVLDNGRMAMCTDPNGAVFAVWQPKRQAGMDVDSHTHGAPGWFETLTSDVGRGASLTALTAPAPGQRPGPRFHAVAMPVTEIGARRSNALSYNASRNRRLRPGEGCPWGNYVPLFRQGWLVGLAPCIAGVLDPRAAAQLWTLEAIPETSALQIRNGASHDFCLAAMRHPARERETVVGIAHCEQSPGPALRWTMPGGTSAEEDPEESVSHEMVARDDSREEEEEAAGGGW